LLYTADWIVMALLPVACAGVFISWLIVLQELGIDNKIAFLVCANTSDCKSVIQSKAARLPFGTGWSDIGMIWFAFLLIVLALSSFAGNTIQTENILSLCATASLPFTFFSLYYQWKIIKKWCRFCLIIVVLLWIQFASLFHVLSRQSWQYITPKDILFTGIILSTTASVWIQMRKLIQDNRMLEKESIEASRFKRNSTVFAALLAKQRSVDITPWQGDLQLGNPAAALQFLVVCSPYCIPCATTHQKLHTLLDRYGQQIGLTVRFAIATGENEDQKKQAIQYILQHIEEATAGRNDSARIIYTREVLHQWFTLMDYNKFSARYPLKANNNHDYRLHLYERWAMKSAITFTPTIFMNGFELPQAYTAEDLPELINELIAGTVQPVTKGNNMHEAMPVNSQKYFVATKVNAPGT
jgi:uncharacterized membrane protein